MRRSGVVVFSLGIVFFGSSLLVFFTGCGTEICGTLQFFGLIFGVPAIGIGAGLMFLPLPRIERPVDLKKLGLGLIGLGLFILLFLLPFLPEIAPSLGALGLLLVLVGVMLWVIGRVQAAFIEEAEE